jgi:hypothetical protein
MKDTDLLQLALGLQTPWQVSKVEFDSVKGQLTILIDFPKGSRFSCSVCGQADCKAYDTESRPWAEDGNLPTCPTLSDTPPDQQGYLN